MSHHAQKPRCRKSWLRPHATVRWSNNLLGFLIWRCEYRAFSLTRTASTLIYWNKRRRLHKKRMQLPQDCLGTTTWPPFHCFGTPIWPPWRHVKTLYKYRLQAKSINVPRILIYHVEGMVFFTKTMRTCWQVYSKVSFSTLIWQFFLQKGEIITFFHC